MIYFANSLIIPADGRHYTAVILTEKTLAQLQDEEQEAFQRMRQLEKESQSDPTKRAAAVAAIKEWMAAQKAVITRTRG
jgi:hypothetical protein